MKKVFVPLADGFEEIEAITIIDVLRRAGIDVVTLSVSDNLFVEGSHQIVIRADKLFPEAEPSDADALILPGGMPGAATLDQNSSLKNFIQAMNKDGKLLGAICAAPLVFGKMGLLVGKKATCYPGFEKFLEGAITLEQKVVVDGNIVTGKGVGAALEFALKFVELFSGKDYSDQLGKKMILE